MNGASHGGRRSLRRRAASDSAGHESECVAEGWGANKRSRRSDKGSGRARAKHEQRGRMPYGKALCKGGKRKLRVVGGHGKRTRKGGKRKLKGGGWGMAQAVAPVPTEPSEQVPYRPDKKMRIKHNEPILGRSRADCAKRLRPYYPNLVNKYLIVPRARIPRYVYIRIFLSWFGVRCPDREKRDGTHPTSTRLTLRRARVGQRGSFAQPRP